MWARMVAITLGSVLKASPGWSPTGPATCCEGTPEVAKRIARVLWNDPATGVIRHADAGYQIARYCAVEQALRLPGILG